ncbi:MAG: ABC transporter permease [Bacteroidales bacterium]
MTSKIVVRNLLKRPFLNFVKVAGLGLSLTGIMVIVLFLRNELTFDRFHKNSDRIYRLTTTDQSVIGGKHFSRVYKPAFVPVMKEFFPEIENYVRLSPVRGGVMKYGEKYIAISEAFECDSTFLTVFDADLISGNPQDVFNDPASMVVSESFARKTFGAVNPLGQILTLPAGQFYGKNLDFTVKGVMKDYPRNSHFHPEFITTPADKTIFDGWAWTYLLLSPNANPGKILAQFDDFSSRHIENADGGSKLEADLQKLTEIHLHSDKLREIEGNGSMTLIYTLSVAALLLLITGLANYANLVAGMADHSYRYLFVSRVFGSSGRSAIKYFLFEGIIILTASMILSLILAIIANIFIQRYFTLNLFSGSLPMILSVAAIFGMTGILCGILPLIKHGNRGSTSDHGKAAIPEGRGLSKSILVLQYTISAALIITVIVIARQTRYALDSGMGTGNENLICFTDVHTNVQNKFEVFKQELLKFNSIASVSAMFEPPGGEANDMFQFELRDYVRDETNKADNLIGIFPCDYSFPEIFGLHFLAGSDFTAKNEDNEGSGEYIINESAMRRLHYSNPGEITGKEFRLIFDSGGIIKIPAGKIIGVVEDFHLSSIRKKVEPLVLFKRKDLWLINFVVSFKPGQQTRALADIKSVWENINPEYPFEYVYVGSLYRSIYRSELIQVKLISIFTFMALFICSMGLLGMSLLSTRRRTKEIGIRKINGAATREILIMLNLDIVKWLIVSVVLSIPIALFAMDKWLQNFAYRTGLDWLIFALAGVAVLTIATLTVSLQSWKAATRNPVTALRYE